MQDKINDLRTLINAAKTKKCLLSIIKRINEIAFNGKKISEDFRSQFVDLKDHAREKYYGL